MIVNISLEELMKLEANTELANSFFNECGIPGIFSLQAFLHNWRMLLNNNMGAIWAYQSNGKTVGMLGGLLSPDMNTGEMTASEAFWYVLKDYRNSIESIKLLIYFEQWAKEIGAKRVVMAHLMASMPEK